MTAAAPGPPLQAVTVADPGPGPADPYAAAGPDAVVIAAPGRTLVGWGVAAALSLPAGLTDPDALARVEAWLAAAAVSGDRPDGARSTVVAFGALPFDPRAPATLVVPELVWCAEPAGTWATLAGAAGGRGVDAARLRRLLAGHRAAAGPGGRPGAAAFGPGALRRSPDAAGYEKAVALALEAIAAGELEKVVLARTVRLARPPVLGPGEACRRLHENEPSCTAFALPVAGGVFLGASPELLVERRGAAVRSLPLAGTAALTGDPAADDAAVAALLASDKDRREQRLVVEAIGEVLAPWCTALSVPAQAVADRLHSVVHLASPVSGTLRSGDGGPGVLPLLAALHPTPAVGGTPRAAALGLIDRLEPAPRGPWAGPVGWVDGAGDGSWVIGIRSATVSDSGATLCAGAGIVAGSDPRAEWAETTVKLRAVLSVLHPGADALLSASG